VFRNTKISKTNVEKCLQSLSKARTRTYKSKICHGDQLRQQWGFIEISSTSNGIIRTGYEKNQKKT